MYTRLQPKVLLTFTQCDIWDLIIAVNFHYYHYNDTLGLYFMVSLFFGVRIHSQVVWQMTKLINILTEIIGFGYYGFQYLITCLLIEIEVPSSVSLRWGLNRHIYITLKIRKMKYAIC